MIFLAKTPWRTTFLRAVATIFVTFALGLSATAPAHAIENLRIYLTVQNAFTFTKYPGLDPEIQANTNDTRGVDISSDLAVGIDWGTVPAPRTWIAGVKMDF